MRVIALSMALLFALSLVGGASADGDPASDVLVSQDIFTPYPQPSAGATQTLANAVQLVHTNGDRVKVAVIATPWDLGSVSSLFGHPADYARFLALELQFVRKELISRNFLKPSNGLEPLFEGLSGRVTLRPVAAGCVRFAP